ncbi:glycerophosphodiester phosphodiesterase family protein [Rhodopila sp.]|uniref:glycerophosphodiester phosphodiesterase family protein n=1 Tax=Rhodopila sp. TaxID=2480087 RepID=UPI003D13C2AB
MQVIGHRGARGRFSENTLEGFRAVAALGISAFELDVGMTADGVVVVNHDPALHPDLTRDASNRWISRPGPLIRLLTWAELARYDVGRIKPGSPTHRLFPEQRPHDSARVPTLASVLAALPDAMFVIEVKTDPTHPDWTVEPTVLADAVLSVVDQTNAATRVVIESFDWRVPSHVRRVRPEIRLAWLTRARTVAAAALWWDGVRPSDHDGSVPACVAAAGGFKAGDAWAPDHADLSEALVHEAHALGLSVLSWTVNRRQDMRRLIGWRVDGLISDRPDVVLEVVREDGCEIV